MATQEEIHQFQTELQAAESTMKTMIRNAMVMVDAETGLSEQMRKLIGQQGRASLRSLAAFHMLLAMACGQVGIQPLSGGGDKDDDEENGEE